MNDGHRRNNKKEEERLCLCGFWGLFCWLFLESYDIIIMVNYAWSHQLLTLDLFIKGWVWSVLFSPNAMSLTLKLKINTVIIISYVHWVLKATAAIKFDIACDFLFKLNVFKPNSVGELMHSPKIKQMKELIVPELDFHVCNFYVGITHTHPNAWILFFFFPSLLSTPF